MQYLYVLILMVGISEAAQPAPVYRAGPSGQMNHAKSLPVPPMQQPAPTPQAEERESQAYATNPETKALGGGQGGVGGVQGQQPTGTKSPSGQNGEQLFQVVYFPGGAHPGQNLQQPQSPYPMTYQAQQPGATAPPSQAGSSYLGNISWIDVVVALTSIGLVAGGSAMLYPMVTGLKSRAMRQLQDLKSEDAARMAKSVMNAIKRFSELNNGRE